MGLPWWLSGKRICLWFRRHGFDAWVGKIPWRRKWQLTPVLLPGEFHGQRSLAGYSPLGHDWATNTFTWIICYPQTHAVGQRRNSVHKNALLINFLLKMLHCKHFSSSSEVLFSFLGQGFLNLCFLLSEFKECSPKSIYIFKAMFPLPSSKSQLTKGCHSEFLWRYQNLLNHTTHCKEIKLVTVQCSHPQSAEIKGKHITRGPVHTTYIKRLVTSV